MSASPSTVPEMFLQRVASTPTRVAYLSPEGNSWREHTWQKVGDRVRAIACGLRALGLQDEERVALLSGTRFEWVLGDLGILCAGGATTTIYPSSTADDTAYILRDSQSRFVFAENAAQLEKLQSRRAELGHVKRVILFDDTPDAEGWALTLAQLEALGQEAAAREPGLFERVAQAVRPQSLATLIYTSGTTGRPKGVELTHDCWVYEGEGINQLGLLTADDVQYLWLPLAHAFGKVLEMAQLRIGFKTAIDGRVDKLVDNLAVVKPTFVAAVPRIFEKVHNKVVGGARAGGGLKLGIFKWAFEVGREVSRHVQAGQSVGPLLALKNTVATRLVFSKLQARFGGNLRFFISGSAPLSRELAEFFHAAGILILEGYGLTESSAASFVNRPGHYRFGTVGLALPGTEVKVASDGEILLRGRGIMRGYHGLAEATHDALDAEGWLHTGDIGEVQDGFLRITDRKKDLIKTSGGKYVAPSDLEGRFKALCPYVSQVLVHGNNRNFVSALVALDEEALRGWAREQSLPELPYAELVKDERVRALVHGYIDKLNSTLASYESIKRFALLPQDLTLEAGELTPSLKVKRKVVEEKYRAVLDGFYGSATEQL